MILVTGGAGFIGSNIVAALAGAGTAVAVCDRLGHDDKWRNIAKHELADIVAPERLMDWLAASAARVDAIVHMGAVSATTETDADLIVDNNFRLSAALWNWCAEHGVRLVYASSAATYGDGGHGFDDGGGVEALSCLRPLNAYGWSKHLFDRWVVRRVAEEAPRPPQWAGLKFFNVYGPNEYHKGSMRSVVVQAYESVAAGRPVTLFRSHRPDYADGGQLRDFVHVGDCVDVVRWLLDRSEVNGLFNMGTGRARSFADLVSAVYAAVGQDPNIVYVDTPLKIRHRYQYFTEAAMERLRGAGYDRSFTGLEDGVADYVRGYLMKDDPYR